MTSLKYRVVPLPTVAFSLIMFPDIINNAELAAEALYTWQETYLGKPPRELSLFPIISQSAFVPPGTFSLIFTAVLATALEGGMDPNAPAALATALEPLLGPRRRYHWFHCQCSLPPGEQPFFAGGAPLLAKRVHWANCLANSPRAVCHAAPLLGLVPIDCRHGRDSAIR